MGKPAKLIGQTFAYLTVVAKTDKRDIGGSIFWKCQCLCGETTMATTNSLRAKNTQSCGCLSIEKATTHGLSKHPLFPRWKAMMQRCYDKSCKSYKNYGAIGVTVCDRWHDPKNFIADMEDTYQPGLELDKDTIKKGNKIYCLEFCTWVSKITNGNHKRNNVYYSFNGKNQTLAQWSKELSIHRTTLYSRIHRRGWPLERAFSESSYVGKNQTHHKSS